MITKRIQILIQEKDFNDALYFTQEEFDLLSEKDIETQAQERYNNWLTFQQTQKDTPPHVNTDEENIALKESLLEQKKYVENQILSVDAKLIK